jgi:hypothetical protein
MLNFWNGSEEVAQRHGQNRFFCDGISYPGSTNRIILSEDLDFVLVGSIKVMPNFLCYLLILILLLLFILS